MEKIEAVHTFHTGSTMLSGLSNFTGISLDQINFIASQLTALFVSFLLRTHFHPSKTKPFNRHVLEILVGLLLGVFCFGSQFIHLILMPGVSYLLMSYTSPKIMQRAVFVFCLAYLSLLHLYRQIYNYGSYSIDVTGPIMVLTQKTTALAFSLHDGLTKKEEEMTEMQKSEAVKNLPNILEYFGYCLTFQTLMAGPAISFKHYKSFIEDECSSSFKKENKNFKLPSPFKPVCQKLAVAVSCGIGFTLLGNMFPFETMYETSFTEEKSVIQKFFYMYVVTFIARLKYYFAWMLAEAVSNNSGLGFNGYDENDQPKWDGVSNVDIIKFETGTNLRESVSGWNIKTNVWLRYVCYERNKRAPTIMTYMLSALWHGFYPGYYLTFITGAVFTVAARNVRRFVRPLFLENNKSVYEVITVLTTRLAMAYIATPFIVLELQPSVQIYSSMWWNLHVLAGFVIFLLPIVFSKSKSKKNEMLKGAQGDGLKNDIKNISSSL